MSMFLSDDQLGPTGRIMSKQQLHILIAVDSVSKALPLQQCLPPPAVSVVTASTALLMHVCLWNVVTIASCQKLKRRKRALAREKGVNTCGGGPYETLEVVKRE
jgi:hypothetical protein